MRTFSCLAIFYDILQGGSGSMKGFLPLSFANILLSFGFSIFYIFVPFSLFFVLVSLFFVLFSLFLFHFLHSYLQLITFVSQYSHFFEIVCLSVLSLNKFTISSNTPLISIILFLAFGDLFVLLLRYSPLYYLVFSFPKYFVQKYE